MIDYLIDCKTGTLLSLRTKALHVLRFCHRLAKPQSKAERCDGAMVRCTGWRVRNDTKLNILILILIQDICRVFPCVFFFSNFLQFFQAARKPEGEGEGPRFGLSLFLSLFSSEILCFVRGKRILCFTVRLSTVLFLVPCFIWFHLVSVAEEPEKGDKADADAELTVELFRAIMKDDAQQDRHRTKQRMG